MTSEPNNNDVEEEMTSIPLTDDVNVPATQQQQQQPAQFIRPPQGAMMHGAAHPPQHTHNGQVCQGHGGHGHGGHGGGTPMMVTPQMMVTMMENQKAAIENHLATMPEGPQSNMLRQKLAMIDQQLPAVRAQMELMLKQQQQAAAAAAQQRRALEAKSDEKNTDDETTTETGDSLSLFSGDPATHNIFSASTVLICGLRADQLSLDAVRYLVEFKGADVAHRTNDGSSAAHWSSKHYNYKVTEYLIEQCKLDPHLPNNAGHPALFWACVSCDIPSANILVKAGAQVSYKDAKETSAFLVACEKGMGGMVDYLIYECGAAIHDVDVMGRNGLHWSAANGFPVTSSVLIRHGISPMTTDNKGETPMHLAVRNGHAKVVSKLLIEGPIRQLEAKNFEDKTPIDIAKDMHMSKKFIGMLERRLRRENSPLLKSIDEKTNWRYALPGMFRVGIMYMIFFYFMQTSAFLISIIHYLKDLPRFYWWIWLDALTGGGMLILCAYVTMKVPGYVPPSTEESDRHSPALIADFDPDELREKYLRALKAGFVKRCCSTCKILRPNRSKHCPSCDRCVYKFDHHCPFVNNCVGRDNYQFFLVYVCLETASVAAFVFFSIHWLIENIALAPFPIFLMLLLVPSVGMSMYGTMFGMMHCRMAVQNITTNEQINWGKYSYLKDPAGKFRNGYNQGVAHNLAVLFHCKEDTMREFGDGGYLDQYFPQTSAIFNAILHEETPSITDPKMAPCDIAFRSRVTPPQPQSPSSHEIQIE